MKTLLVPNQAELPEIAQVPNQPRAHRWVRQIGKAITNGTLLMRLPDGSEHTLVGRDTPTPQAQIEIHQYRALSRLLLHGDLGFAEAYLAGEWSSNNLSELFAFGLANEDITTGADATWSGTRFIARLRHLLNTNSRRQAKKNIAYHYDLGNDFYQQWLDPSMTYSAALFAGEPDDPAGDLAAAQHNKYTRLARTLEVSENDEILEIGCGWGGFMQHVIEHSNANITGVSISREQCAYASERLARIDSQRRARVLFKDYRDLTGQYDRIASIEMFEAVGEKYWSTYTNKLKQLLKPGGVAALQIITIAEDRFEHYRNATDFIQRYIFPGGMLPTRAILPQLMRESGLKVTDEFRFGSHYAATLRCWRDRFDAAWPTISALGFDERFRRMWHYYLAYCEVGFDNGALDVVQIRVEHDS